tara:strand:+ start:2183 stop:2992 length:810 start_codon:yes stop_codon:yes gene_type:complete
MADDKVKVPHKNTKLHRFTEDVEEKQCGACHIWQTLAMFSKNNTWDKLDNKCKACYKVYRANNRERLNAKHAKYRAEHKEDRKEWLKANKEQQAEYNKEYHAKYRVDNKDQLKQHKKEYFQKNKATITEKQIARRKANPELRMLSNLRCRISIAIRGKAKSDATKKLIGCTVKFLREHLESQFDDKMTWDNYGEWHVDHIVPCAIYNMGSDFEQRSCFNYRNLQPLWGTENMSKNDNVMGLDVDKLPETTPMRVVNIIRVTQGLEEIIE